MSAKFEKRSLKTEEEMITQTLYPEAPKSCQNDLFDAVTLIELILAPLEKKHMYICNMFARCLQSLRNIH